MVKIRYVWNLKSIIGPIVAKICCLPDHKSIIGPIVAKI